MWTVVVEVHLGEKGTVFQVGSFINSYDAHIFAHELEWEIGEEKITTHALKSENLFEWLVSHTLAKQRAMKQWLNPPCLDDEVQRLEER